MVRLILALPLVTGALLTAAGPAGTYQNPVIDAIGPADPDVIEVDGQYFLYPTGDDSSYHVYTSTDLVHWTKGAEVFRPGEKHVWAPDVYRHTEDGRYYLYYTVNRRVGVAIGDRPDGTFEDKGTLVRGAIDGHLFRDDDGRLYLYYVKVPGFIIHCWPMGSPTAPDGDAIAILRPTEPWERISGAVTEGPFMLKRNGVYYLLFSGTGADSVNYAVGYATSKRPTGPFVKYAGNPIIKSGDGAVAPGHGSVIHDGAGDLWHVYHQKKDGTAPWNRFICIDRIEFDAKGVLHGTASRNTPRQAPIPLPRQ